jgi:hypothetical protein
MTIIEWMGTQEALPGEDATQRWTVPADVTMLRSPNGIDLYRGNEARFHPWHRVRWIGSTLPAVPDVEREPGPGIGDGLSAPTTPEGKARFEATYGYPPKDPGATILPPADAERAALMDLTRGPSIPESAYEGHAPIAVTPKEDAVLDKLSERQGRRRKR